MNQDKKTLSEPEVCDRFITPAIRHAGWSLEQIRREYQLTDGQVMVGGQKATRNKSSIRRADYITRLSSFLVSRDYKIKMLLGLA